MAIIAPSPVRAAGAPQRARSGWVPPSPRRARGRCVAAAKGKRTSGAPPPASSGGPQQQQQQQERGQSGPAYPLPRPPTEYSGGAHSERAADAAAAAVATAALGGAVSTASGSLAAQPPREVHIDGLRKHPHQFTAGQPNTCGGSIVVAMDDTDDSAAALEWVARNLYHPGTDELRLVQVVCDPRSLLQSTSVGTTPTGRPISVDSRDLATPHASGPESAMGGGAAANEVSLEGYVMRLAAEAAASLARRSEALKAMGIEYQSELPCLPAARSAAGIAELLLEAVRRNDAKLLVVASRGPGALAEFGSVSRYCYQHCPVPLLLLPSLERQSGAAATAARGAAAPAAGVPTAPVGEVLLVVNHLEELANVWQWVTDNCARKGDTLSIWHVAGPSQSGMPSLPTALTNQILRRGLEDVSFSHLYSSTGDNMDLADQVCQMAAAARCKLVVLLNYSRRGLVQEALHGSIASHLSRHCPKPLLLLQHPE